MEKLYPPKVKHSLEYYHTVLDTLADKLSEGLKDGEIASSLNSKGIMSASGKPWTVMAVRQALHKIRNYESTPSHLYSAMLQLYFDGKFTRDKATTLLTYKRKTM